MDILEAAIVKLNGVGAVAKHLGVSSPFISQVRSGVKPLPPLQAAKLAELLEQNPAQAYVEAAIISAGKSEAASLRRWFKSVAAIIVVAVVVAGHSGSYPWTCQQSRASTPNVRARKRRQKFSRHIQCVQCNAHCRQVLNLSDPGTGIQLARPVP